VYNANFTLFLMSLTMPLLEQVQPFKALKAAAFLRVRITS
jgi:hypothetical protein